MTSGRMTPFGTQGNVGAPPKQEIPRLCVPESQAAFQFGAALQVLNSSSDTAGSFFKKATIDQSS